MNTSYGTETSSGMRMVRFCFMRHNEFAAGLRRAKEYGHLNVVVSLRRGAATGRAFGGLRGLVRS
jgi:hypothetical protein